MKDWLAFLGFPGGSVVAFACQYRILAWSLGQGKIPGVEGDETHSSILPLEILWTEDSQSMGLQKTQRRLMDQNLAFNQCSRCHLSVLHPDTSEALVWTWLLFLDSAVSNYLFLGKVMWRKRNAIVGIEWNWLSFWLLRCGPSRAKNILSTTRLDHKVCHIASLLSVPWKEKMFWNYFPEDNRAFIIILCLQIPSKKKRKCFGQIGLG